MAIFVLSRFDDAARMYEALIKEDQTDTVRVEKNDETCILKLPRTVFYTFASLVSSFPISNKNSVFFPFQLSRKRLIAILKTQKKYREAIEELTDYLRTYVVTQPPKIATIKGSFERRVRFRFQNDQEAWLELVELYCHELDYNKASFCMEEALIHHPHNHLYHQRYAEIRYALGGYDNIDTARVHFAKAVQLCRSNTDALYGMCIVRMEFLF